MSTLRGTELTTPNPTSITAYLTHANGHTVAVQTSAGQSLMRAALAAGVEAIAADCGGCLSCATCHVQVAPAWAAALPAPSVDELAMLAMTAEPAQPNSRLSCQIVMQPALDGLCATLPATQY